MTKTTVIREINAPVEEVFSCIADTSKFKEAIPHIVKVEMLSEQTTGNGTRFRETRLMNGREASTELEFSDYVQNEQVRAVADSGGAIWDTLFTTENIGSDEAPKTKLTLVMEARAYKLMAKIVTPFIKGIVQKAVEEDMDSVKLYCEQSAS